MSDVSNNLNELAKAYTRAFAEITNAIKNTTNPHLGNNYADLGSVLATVRPVFARHGLAVMQAPGRVAFIDGVHVVSVVTTVMHESGQMVAYETMVPIAPQTDKKTGKDRPIDAQRAGSAITYARRYALAAIAGITQQDDDGEAAGSSASEEPDTAALSKSIAAAKTVDELEALREDVRLAGVREVGNEFLAKMRELKGKK